MITIDCNQNSPEWFAARRGIPTASEFSRIITPARLGYSSKAKVYMSDLLADLLTQEDGFNGNAHTERGNALEPEAISAYGFLKEVEPKRVGFVMNDDRTAGASPDAWQLEVKCPMAKTHVAWSAAGTIPDEHLIQVHGNMVICETDWWDFMSYHPALPPLILRATRNNITAAVEQHLARFIGEYADFKAAYCQRYELEAIEC